MWDEVIYKNGNNNNYKHAMPYIEENVYNSQSMNNIGMTVCLWFGYGHKYILHVLVHCTQWTLVW